MEVLKQTLFTQMDKTAKGSKKEDKTEKSLKQTSVYLFKGSKREDKREKSLKQTSINQFY